MTLSAEEKRARSVLSALIQSSFDTAASDLAEAHHCTVEDICGTWRTPHVARARYALWARMREAGLSYPAIGKIVGRDHCTVINGIKVYAAWQLAAARRASLALVVDPPGKAVGE